MSYSLPNMSLFGRRLTISVMAFLLVALTATSVDAQPATDATVHPLQQSQATLETAPAAPVFTEPLSPPAGSLDPSFDGDGIVTTVFGPSPEQARAVAMQSDGKIVVAGNANNGGSNDFALARYNSNGSLDTSFDTDGKVTTDFGSNGDQAYAVTIQSDGKIVVAGVANNDINLYFALARYNSNGSLDTSFDADGKVTTDFGNSQDYAYAVAIQSDGKIVVAGYGMNIFALARYNSNGSLDTSFDTDGKVTTVTGSSGGTAYGVAIQSDGKIVVAGSAYNAGDHDFALVRYNSNGTLDTSFDADGKVTTAFGSANDRAYAVAIQSNGKIVLAGHAGPSNNNDFALARYNSNGSLDTAFDLDGKVTTDFGFSLNDYAYALSIQSDGKIVVAGGTGDFALARYNSNGSLDTSFDFDGKVMTAIGSNIDRAAAIAIQSDGKIVVAGVAYNGSNDDFALARYQVASTSSQTIADNASATLEGVTITNHSGTSCTLTVTKYPVPPGGAPATTGEMPVIWQLTTTCSTYNYDLVFSYTDTELLFGNSVTEASLRAYRAPDTGGGFTLVGGTVNTTANTVTVTGVTQLSWWTLSSSAPTAVTLADFSAVQQGDMVLVTWETNSELENRGFNLYRGTSSAGPDRQLNQTLIPSQSQGNPGGFIYTWEDRADLAPGTSYFYWVEDVDIYGAATMHGPVSVDFSVPTAVEVTGLAASSTRAAFPAWLAVLAALLAALTGAALIMRRFTIRGQS